MAYNHIVTEQDLELLAQPNKTAYLKAEILDYEKLPLYQFEDVITDLSITIDANSDNRRSASITLHPKDETYYRMNDDSKLWFNHFLRCHLGFWHCRTQSVVWYCIGTFLIDEATFRLDESSGEMTISCKDLFQLLNGTEGGAMKTRNATIPEGSLIAGAMTALIAGAMTALSSDQSSIPDYLIDDMGQYRSVDSYITELAQTHKLFSGANDASFSNTDAAKRYKMLLQAKADAKNENILFFSLTSFKQEELQKLQELQGPQKLQEPRENSSIDSQLPPAQLVDSAIENIIVLDLSDETVKSNVRNGIQPGSVLRERIFTDHDFENLRLLVFVPDKTLLPSPEAIYDAGKGWGYTKNGELVFDEKQHYCMAAFFRTLIEVPYRLEFHSQDTIGSMGNTLRDLYPGWETFFDPWGTFVAQRIPGDAESPPVLDADTMASLCISASPSYPLSDVKNVVKIIGADLNPEHFATECKLEGSVYQATIEGFENYTVNQPIAVYIPENNPDNAKLQIIGKDNTLLASCSILDAATGKPYPANTFLKGQVYIFYYSYDHFCYKGQFEASAVAMLVGKNPTTDQKKAWQEEFCCNNLLFRIEPDSPFCVEKIGVRYILNPDSDIKGTNYDSITSDALAGSMAQYMLWKMAALQDSLELQTLIIPFLDVNQKIEFRNPLSKEIESYMIHSIRYTLSNGTMDISASRFCELYPKLKGEETI